MYMEDIAMNKRQAEQLAKIYKGIAEQTGGNVWVVTVVRTDGGCIVFGHDSVSYYDSIKAFNNGETPRKIIDIF